MRILPSFLVGRQSPCAGRARTAILEVRAFFVINDNIVQGSRVTSSEAVSFISSSFYRKPRVPRTNKQNTVFLINRVPERFERAPVAAKPYPTAIFITHSLTG